MNVAIQTITTDENVLCSTIGCDRYAEQTITTVGDNVLPADQWAAYAYCDHCIAAITDVLALVAKSS
jgi:hypothetical protein